MSTALDAPLAGSRHCPKSLEAQREPVAIWLVLVAFWPVDRSTVQPL
ncbi:MAG: hypothetical protein WBF73_32650 [Bradyrhizobium sp.]